MVNIINVKNILEGGRAKHFASVQDFQHWLVHNSASSTERAHFELLFKVVHPEKERWLEEKYGLPKYALKNIYDLFYTTRTIEAYLRNPALLQLFSLKHQVSMKLDPIEGKSHIIVAGKRGYLEIKLDLNTAMTPEVASLTTTEFRCRIRTSYGRKRG